MSNLPENVRVVLDGEFHGCDLVNVELLGEGWNATAWRIGAEGTRWVIRVPKLDWAAGEIERQTRLGPHLAELGFRVPRGWRLFRDDHGTLVAGAYVYVDGNPAPTRGKRRLDRLARDIAHFLTRLHDVPTDFPLRECRALDLDPWPGRYRDLIARYGRMTGPRTQSWLRHVGARLERASSPALQHVLVHGDLAPEHVLCSADGGIASVLDFSGPQVTDAALDFGRLVQHWGVKFAESVLETYERPTEVGFRERMLAYAWLEPLRTIEAGVLRGLPQWVRWGKRRLAATAAAESRCVESAGVVVDLR